MSRRLQRIDGIVNASANVSRGSQRTSWSRGRCRRVGLFVLSRFCLRRRSLPPTEFTIMRDFPVSTRAESILSINPVRRLN